MPCKDNSTIGGRIKALREKKGLTQQEALRKLDLGRFTSTLSRMETNDQDIPAKTLIKICKFYRVSADELLGLDNQGNSDTLDLRGLTSIQKSAFITLRRDIR